MRTSGEQDELHAMRHSLAHIMANAIQHIWPEAKFGVGPVIENGFYYDVDLGETSISDEDFATLESEMHRIIKANEPFEKIEMNVDDAIRWAEDNNQPYKVELLNDLKRAGTTVAKDLSEDELGTVTSDDSKVETVSFYRNGDFTDLCRGPHAASTGKVGHFKLLRVSGAYWRGKTTNAQMQRVYGVAFAEKSQLDGYLRQVQEAKDRDHRKLGHELDLFVFSDLVGSGLPLYTPRGTVIRNQLIGFSEEVREELGFERVWSPHITKKDLYEVSGHWAKFGDELFLVKSQETSDDLVMKPMNCPHHAQIYASRPHSYRELPIKLMETTTNYRDEKTGELLGLSRVRSLTQDDSHTYCRPDQVDEVFDQLITKIQNFYETLDMTLRLRLSLRDSSSNYLGPEELWKFGQEKLKSIAERNQLEYFAAEGEAAFYGPKLDFMATDALGREWQVATIQFDFVQPERFGLEYTDEEGASQRPIMIHCAIMGSFDRFFSVYIEHTAGRFPVWLAPEQLRISTVNQEEKVVTLANEIAEKARLMKLRVKVDDSNESVGKKIRNAEIWKVPYSIVIGEKEVETRILMPRIRKDLELSQEHSALEIDELLEAILRETRSRSKVSSL